MLINVIFILIASTYSIVATSAVNEPPACETYARAKEPKQLRVVSSEKEVLSRIERAMVQTAIHIVEPAEALTPGQALDEFRSVRSNFSNAGDLKYFAISGGRVVVRVTYYPGENEYGALFLYQKSLTSMPDSVMLIGVVTDGDVRCLNYVDGI